MIEPISTIYHPWYGAALLTQQVGIVALGLGLCIVKVGTFDAPKQYPGPQLAIFTCDKQEFHHTPEEMQAFDKIPG